MYVNKKFAMREKHINIILGPDQIEGWGQSIERSDLI